MSFVIIMKLLLQLKEEDRELAEQLGRSVTLQLGSPPSAGNRNRLVNLRGDDSDSVFTEVIFSSLL